MQVHKKDEPIKTSFNLAKGEVLGLYTGDWDGGKPDGEGKFTQPRRDGIEYFGFWSKGKKNGPGTYTSKLGDKCVRADINELKWGIF